MYSISFYFYVLENVCLINLIYYLTLFIYNIPVSTVYINIIIENLVGDISDCNRAIECNSAVLK